MAVCLAQANVETLVVSSGTTTSTLTLVIATCTFSYLLVLAWIYCLGNTFAVWQGFSQVLVGCLMMTLLWLALNHFK